jgi:GNAT superfamily N-acetyltransferase
VARKALSANAGCAISIAEGHDLLATLQTFGSTLRRLATPGAGKRHSVAARYDATGARLMRFPVEASVSMPITIRILGPDDGAMLQQVAPDVFDGPVDARWSAEFLADPRHHLAVAIDDGQVVAMASALHYVHPDKPPELWVNEVGVAATHQGRGIGRQVLAALLERARTLGCQEARVLTSPSNTAARRMYAAAGGREESESPVMIAFDLTDAAGS